MKNSFILLAIFFLAGINAQSQTKIASAAYIDTYYHGQKFFSIKEAAMVFYEREQGELNIEIDFSNFKSGVDSLDEWLIDLTETKFTFKAHLAQTDLLILTHHNTKSLSVTGTASFNNQSHPMKIQFNMYEISREGMLMITNTNDVLDRIAANIQLSIYPKDFGINKKPHHLKKVISVAIGRAVLNH
ncbi:MAG: hypothetical protein JNJ40_01410 [Bacteroidia bacterium]|nr:hypothetical protein [Bacteroidia bacterium]